MNNKTFKNMKIAIDCRMYKQSGIGVFLENILLVILERHKNHSFLLIGDSDQLSTLVSKNNNCSVLHCQIPIFSFNEIFNFPTNEINKCDVFYSPNYNIPGGIKIPIYSTIHDVVFLDVDGLTSKLGIFIRKIFLKRAIHKSKKIFTVSLFSKERIIYHLGSKKTIEITYNSIRHDLLDYNPINNSPLFNFPYIVFIGNIKKQKGLSVLLDAYNKITKNTDFSHKLVIVGNADNFRTTDTLTESYITSKMNKNIVFTGHVSDDELYNILSHADVLVQPSTYEGFGIPPMEALYLGCNVLLSDIPVFKEIYGDFPVTFFRTNDVDDFGNKIVNICKFKKDINVDNVRQLIKLKYDANKSVEIIIDSLSK